MEVLAVPNPMQNAGHLVNQMQNDTHFIDAEHLVNPMQNEHFVDAGHLVNPTQNEHFIDAELLENPIMQNVNPNMQNERFVDAGHLGADLSMLDPHVADIPEEIPINGFPMVRLEELDANVIDSLFDHLGLMDILSCQNVCDDLRRMAEGRGGRRSLGGGQFEVSSVPNGRYGNVDLSTCLRNVNDILRVYGPQMKTLKSDYNRFVDKYAVVSISQMIKMNCVNLEHFDFYGSSNFPDIADMQNFIPDLSRLKSLGLKNFTRFTNDHVIGSYLQNAFNSLEKLSMEDMWINGSCLEVAPPVKSLTLRNLKLMNMDYVQQYLNRCSELSHLEFESPGLPSGRYKQMFGSNLHHIESLKIKMDNRSSWMEVLDVIPFGNCPNLKILELDTPRTNDLNSLIYSLAQRNIIERLALVLNTNLLTETVHWMSLFTNLQSLKLTCHNPTIMFQLDGIFRNLSANTRISTIELRVKQIDLRHMCQNLLHIEHLSIRVDGPCFNIQDISTLFYLKTIDLTFGIHDNFFVAPFQNDAAVVQMACLLPWECATESLTFTLLASDCFSLSEMAIFQEFADSENMKYTRVDDEVYELGTIAAGARFEVNAFEQLEGQVCQLMAMIRRQPTVIRMLQVRGRLQTRKASSE